MPELEIKGSKNLCPCRLRRTTIPPCCLGTPALCVLSCRLAASLREALRSTLTWTQASECTKTASPEASQNLGHPCICGRRDTTLSLPSPLSSSCQPKQASHGCSGVDVFYIVLKSLTRIYLNASIHADILQTHTIVGDLLQHLKPKSLANIFYL